MSQLKDLWKAGSTWTQQFGTRRIQRQQWNDAEDTELRKLASSSSALTQDTAYRPHSTHSGEGNFVDVDLSKKDRRASRRYTLGWRFGAINCAISASIVFLINFIVTIWGSVHNKSHGGVLYEGDCEKVRQLNTGIHFLINLLSTILLSSSNYCMQCLSAPTRREVDEAHAQRVWLDIGVPSIHNLKRISTRRAILWFLLGLSSLPLHLFYNSAVFSSISSNNYYAVSVPQSFVDDDECYNCGNISDSGYEFSYTLPYDMKDVALMMHAKARNGTLQKLNNADCIGQYAEMIQTNRRNVLLVANDDKFPPPNTNPIGASKIWSVLTFDARDAAESSSSTNIYQWICSNLTNPNLNTNEPPCTSVVDQIKKQPADWKVGYRFSNETYDYSYNITYGHNRTSPGWSTQTYNLGFEVQYCLSEEAEPHCKLKFTLPIAILVTILNIFKAALIFYTAFATKEDPLMNMGDAVASFLEKSDPTTKDMCLLSVHEVKKYKHYFPAGPREWDGKKRKWKDVTSVRRRSVTFIMFSVIVIVVGSLYGFGVSQLPEGQSHSLPALARLGYGAIDPRTIINYGIQLNTIRNVLVANIAQPILSFLYFSYNGLFTCMLLGYEWASYASRRKGLRVSRTPSGAQRSTYFLQLPYRFALPLMVLSGFLHWIVSQSIFLVAIDVWDWDGSRPWDKPGASEGIKEEGDWTSCGYSPIAIFTALMMGILMTISIIAFGFVPFKPGLNLAASNSAAISAACHIKDDEVDGYTAARERLQWGVVSVNSEGVGHCAFSTKQVEMPKVGEVYAGGT